MRKFQELTIGRLLLLIGATMGMGACAADSPSPDLVLAPRERDQPSVVRLEAAGPDRVRAVLAPDHGGAERLSARVELPRRASGSVRVEDTASSVALEVVLHGAADVPIELVNGLAVYRGAFADGADLIHRVRADGTEDFVAYARKPEREEIVYDVNVSRAAGLRLVANTLELLDARGAPRLRVSPPSVRDASGEHLRANLSLVGCGADTSPAPPWNRPVTAPCGARASSCRCEVHVQWGDAHVRYPAIVDPAWSATGNLATERAGHSAGVLKDGRGFVVGGHSSGSAYLTSMEIYDAASGTWAAGADLAEGRSHFNATALGDGRVLVAAGRNDSTVLKTAEIYDPATSTWGLTGSLSTAREFHTATLTQGKVLVAGGLGTVDSSGIGLYTAEIYDPGTGTWSSAGKMASRRAFHAATALADANERVLIIGGFSGGSSAVLHATTEIYDPLAKSWKAAKSMTSARRDHAAARLTPGLVLVVGGTTGTPGALEKLTGTAEIYDAMTDTWAPAPPLATARSRHSVTLLGDGHVLVVGGKDSNDSLQSAEVLLPGAAAWTPAGAMVRAHSDHTAVLLGTDAVLVAGGLVHTNAVSFAELFHELAATQMCTDGGECASGRCSAGVCCDQPCNEACRACTAAEKGSGPDGVCGMAAGNPCKEYQCDAFGACKTACTSKDDCTTGNACSNGSCVSAEGHTCDGNHTIMVSDGSSLDCGLLRCSKTTNECIPMCDGTSANCVAGATCGADGACVSEGVPPPIASGCAATPGGATGSDWLIRIAGLSLMLAARGRARGVRTTRARR